MSKLNWNRSPYNDDFDSNRNYMKILFRPGRPVQTRELNQIQSIVQNQIQLFANHIFKNGSRVSNGSANYRPQSYVRLEDNSPWTSQTVDTRYFTEGVKIMGQTTGITAVVVLAAPKVGEDPHTIYLVYQSIAIDGQTISFLPGEVINVYDKNSILVYSVKVRCPGCVGSVIEDTIPVTGTGTIFTIDEGVFYFEGMFIESRRQMILVSKYGESTFCKIGFDFVQNIVTSDDDQSLLDNTLGYPNSTAPGADRYKTTLVLTKRALNSEDGDDFILLALVEGEGYRYLKGDSEYSDIMDMIAKRTFETNGNFTVVPFKIKIMEEKADSPEDDLGYSIIGDPDYLRIAVTGGISYVKGYRFKNDGEQFIRCYKARDSQKHRSFIKRFEERSSIDLIPLRGYSAYPNRAAQSPVIDNTIINIYDGPFGGGGVPTGDLIGTCRIYDVNYVSGVIQGISNPAIFKYYFFDLKMIGNNQLSSAMSFTDSTGTTGFRAIPADPDVTIHNPGKTELLWRLQRDNIKTLRDISESGDPDPSGSIQIFLRKKLIGTLNSQGSVTFTSISNESFEEFDPYRTVATIIDTDGGAGIARTINISGKTSITSTEFIVNLGGTVDVGTGTLLSTAGKTISIVHSVMRVNSTESQKQESFIQNTNFNPNQGPFNSTKNLALGITDAFKIDYVTARDITNVNDPGVDITSQFSLNKNFKDSVYDESQLIYHGEIPQNQNIRWSYRIIYIDHNHSSHLGYFNIDSYRDLISSGLMSYDDNPIYIANNKTEYPLFGSYDFRPNQVGNTIQGETVPVIGSTAVFDIEYYLPRIDLLSVGKDGRLYITYGNSADKPIPPKPDPESMALYELHLKPYTYSINDVSTKYIENKRYTMRDIGKIEQRIKVIEYYTVLNLLEKSAADMNIKDANGLDRFKNGFVADNFQDYQAADILSTDFRASLDRKRRELRPAFTPRNKEFEIDVAGSNCKLLGSMALIDYESVMVNEQPYATKHISINPYFQFKKKGVMVLLPNMDVWSDTTILPELVIDIDTGAEDLRKLASASGLLGTHWGAWADLSRTVQTVGNNQQAVGGRQGGGQTTTTTTQQQRQGNEVSMGSRTDTYDMGERVTDVSLNPWMRERDITFMAVKMKPNARVYPFFDGKLVSQWTRTLLGLPGGDLITDGNGEIAGIFHCPEGMFHTGDRNFKLTTDKNQTGDPDLEFTMAESVFFSGGLNQTKQHTTMNVTVPTVDVVPTVERRTVVDVAVVPGAPPPPPPAPPAPPPPPVDRNPANPPPPPRECHDGTIDTSEFHFGMNCWVPDGQGGCWQRCTCCNWCERCRDPVAQGFKLDRNHFITAIDLYFESVDTNSTNDISIQIRTMDNGYPTSVVLGSVNVSPETLKLFVSDDSTTPFHAVFDFPIFVEGGVSYCFVVAGWSPETRIWVSKLGMPIINQPGKIVETQPSLESSFRSQNGETWNAEQLEDIKYKLYAARFKSDSMTIQFKNKHERLHLERDPFEGQINESRIRVYVDDHGLKVGDKVTISLFEDNWFEIDIPAGQGQMNIGMIIRTSDNSFSGVVADYKTDQLKSYIKIDKMKGSFAMNQGFICDQIDKPLHNNYLITKVGYKGSDLQSNGVVRFNTVSGFFRSATPADIVFNGFPFSELSRNHTIVEVDSMDTFIIQASIGVAQANGRFGGEGCSININEKYEMFNVTGEYIPYGSTEVWSYKGIGHNPPNGPFEADDYRGFDYQTFNMNTDTFLEQPHKVVSEDNALNDSHFIKVAGSFKTPNEWVSPIINTDSFSIITVSNRVEWMTSAQINVTPNATGRFFSESDPMNGSENYKYVTKTINLANPASDLVIAFDVYKDIQADYDVWVKIVKPYDSSDIDTLRWMRVIGLDKTYHSADLNDRVEYEITMSRQQVEVYTSNDTFTVVDWDTIVDEFKTFKVKVVGKTRNPALPPLFQSLRCIAVT